MVDDQPVERETPPVEIREAPAGPRAQFDGDLPQCFAHGDAPGLDIPEALAGLSLHQLRLVDGVVIDAATLKEFFIDHRGQKHAIDGDGWQKLKVGWDDPIIKRDKGWGLRTDADAPPRCVDTKRFRYALNAAGQRAAWDKALAGASQDTRDYWETEPNPPENNAKLKRLAKASGVDLKALYDSALAI